MSGQAGQYDLICAYDRAKRITTISHTVCPLGTDLTNKGKINNMVSNWITNKETLQ
jgi:hypothetical protein